MKTIGIIAEFNPFHKGHEYLIDICKNKLQADYCVVVMSGDFVQRGAPAIISKYTRARMVLSCGADLVLELPVYYSLGSAEYFAEGAISLLDKLGCVDYLCFGAETPDLNTLGLIADVLVREPDSFKEDLEKELKNGLSFPLARKNAILNYLSKSEPVSLNIPEEVLDSPNNILAIEYLKAIKTINSKMTPFAIKREGAEYHSEEIKDFASAQGIRSYLFSNENSNSLSLSSMIPANAYDIFTAYNGKYLDCNDFSDLLYYRLLMEKDKGYQKYLDVTEDLSNRILSSLDTYADYDSFCDSLKTRNLTYTRISRCLLHILLNITKDNMIAYKNNDYTVYGKILGMKKASSPLLSKIQESETIPVLNRLKDAKEILNPLQMNLFEESLRCSSLYNKVARNNISSEYRLKPIIL